MTKDKERLRRKARFWWKVWYWCPLPFVRERFAVRAAYYTDLVLGEETS